MTFYNNYLNTPETQEEYIYYLTWPKFTYDHIKQRIKEYLSIETDEEKFFFIRKNIYCYRCHYKYDKLFKSIFFLYLKYLNIEINEDIKKQLIKYKKFY
jgi:hypothetical protein